MHSALDSFFGLSTATSVQATEMVFNFHQGELAVQSRMGVLDEAAHALAAGWMGTSISSNGESQMSDSANMKEVYMTSVDSQGRIWTSVLMGSMPGFVTPSPSHSGDGTVEVNVNSGARKSLTYKGDPLNMNIQLPNAPVGMLLKGYKNRRRYRIDGRMLSASTASVEGGGNDEPLVSSLTFTVTMAMGNCPMYLHVRDLVGEEQAPVAPIIERSIRLSQAQMELISLSESFILGTFANVPDGGADASNRGGNPGFVQAVDDSTIVFPDYKGNNLYLSLGNIAANPRAGLLFINRIAGDVLQVSGEANILWGDQPIPGGEGPAKRVEIKVLEVIEAKGANPLRMRMKELSPFSPPVKISARYLATRPAADAGGNHDSAPKQHLVRCVEVLDTADGIKSFRFKAVQGERLPPWTPGQFATFFFPSGECLPGSGGSGSSSTIEGLYTLPAFGCSRQSQQSRQEVVVRTWTITSVYENDNPLEVTIQAKLGGVSAELHQGMRPGDLARVTIGGDFTLTERLGAPPHKDSKILLLSAGIGITPAAGILRWLKQRETTRCSDSTNRCLIPSYPDVVLIHATRSLEVMPFFNEIDEEVAQTGQGVEKKRLQAVVAITASSPQPQPQPQPHPIQSPAGTDSKEGYVSHESAQSGQVRPPLPDKGGISFVSRRPDTEMLKVRVPDIAERQVFLCGPEVFMVAMDRALRGLGVPASAIHSEDFSF